MLITTASRNVETRQDGTVTEANDAKNKSLNYGAVRLDDLDGCGCLRAETSLMHAQLSEAQQKSVIFNKSSAVHTTYFVWYSSSNSSPHWIR